MRFIFPMVMWANCSSVWKREGLANNTVVVISSDHGPLFRGKQFLYDGGIHIPLMIRFPGRPRRRDRG